ncbi:hypothetical protein [Tissierella sp.]
MILVVDYIIQGPMEKLLLSPKQEWTKKFSAANIKLDRRKWEWMEY